MTTMELIEIETEQTMQREEAAKLLHRLADSLERHNEVEFLQEGLKFRVRVPDEIQVEIELEIEDDGSSIEIELSW
jgi:amphi-Trp domain-containing protein